jgi:glutathione peroxidase
MSVHDFPITLMDGTTTSLKAFEGQVLLLVNTATKCGLAGQFSELEALYQTYKGQGLQVIGFPCNQFKNQEPGSNEEVLAECQLNFGVTFPLTQKIDVNGPTEDPLFTHLKKEKKGLLGDDIKWNFTKFLVSKKGDVLKRVAPQVSPNSMIKEIEKALKA